MAYVKDDGAVHKPLFGSNRLSIADGNGIISDVFPVVIFFVESIRAALYVGL